MTRGGNSTFVEHPAQAQLLPGEAQEDALKAAEELAQDGRGTLFTKLGDVGALPPLLAAWSPHVLFTTAASFLLVRLRT